MSNWIIEPSPEGATPHGFRWGQLEVQRIAEFRGSKIINVWTAGGRRLEIAVSPKGNNVRVWLDHEQMGVGGE